MEIPRERNRALCRKYPWLIPANRFSGKRITEASDGGFWPGSPESVPEYDYEWTELDAMPRGWRLAFGEQLCEELGAALDKAGLTDSYRITQIKEKYGMLCWYDRGGNDETDRILHRYAERSKRTCIKCGKPATLVTTGWICPYCTDCVTPYEQYVPIGEWLNETQGGEANV